MLKTELSNFISEDISENYEEGILDIIEYYKNIFDDIESNQELYKYYFSKYKSWLEIFAKEGSDIPLNFIRFYKDIIDNDIFYRYGYIYERPDFEEMIEEFKDLISWGDLCYCYELTPEFVRKYINYLRPWWVIAYCETNIPDEIIEEYRDEINQALMQETWDDGIVPQV